MHCTMKKIYCFLHLLILLSFTDVYSQWLDKVNKIKNIQSTREALEFVKEETVEQLKKMKEKNYTADLNYAVSFSDNSGIYESKEKFGRLEKTMLYALSPEALADRTPEEKARDYNDVGEMMYNAGKYNSALISFMTANVIYINQGKENTKDNSLVLSNIGLLYHTTGRYNLALDYSVKALEIRERIGNDNEGLTASYNNLGVLNKDMGNYTEADEYIEKSLQLIRENDGENSTPHAIVLNNKAILNQQMGKYKDAEEILKEAIRKASDDLREKSPNFIRMKVNLALLYQLQEKYSDAEEIYLDAISLKKRRLGTNHPDYAVLLRNLASLYMLTEQYDKVEQNLIEARDIFRDKFGEENPAYALTLHDLGRFYLFTGNLNEANTNLEMAEKIQKEALGTHHPVYVDTREAQAILKWQMNENEPALEAYKEVLDEYLNQIHTFFPAMSDYDKSKFWEKIHPKFIRFYSYATGIYNENPEVAGLLFNYHVATKALLLNDANKVKNRILSSGNPGLIDKYNEWIDLKKYLARCYTLGQKELQEDNINIDSLEMVANTREKELSKLSSDFASSREAKTPDYKEISNNLKSGEACIEFIRFNNYQGLMPDSVIKYAALVLKNNQHTPALEIYEKGNEMETTYARLYKTEMQNANENSEFYHVYWGQLEELTTETRNLYISPDGIFNQVNLNTLKSPSGQYLINKKNIYYITSSKELLKKVVDPTTVTANNAVLIGNPHFAKDINWDKVTSMPLQELPGTETEINKIETEMKSRNYKTTVYKYESATEENIKTVKNPAVFHVATHGFFMQDLPSGNDKIFGIEPLKAAENPLLRSGLMLAGADNTIQQIGTIDTKKKDDGILNAYEAMLLNLDNTEMVVLSACETGLGETKNGEGVYGLQRAFQIAGASSIIISLWEVSDNVTQELMTTFYKRWLTTKNKHAAFREAQLHVKARHPEPFYWGAFIMVGK